MCLKVFVSLINGLCEAVFCDQSGRDSLHVSKTLFCNSLRVDCILEQWFKTTHLYMEKRSSGNDQPPQKVPPSHSHFLRPHAMTSMPTRASRMQPLRVETAVWIWVVLPDLSRKQGIVWQNNPTISNLPFKKWFQFLRILLIHFLIELFWFIQQTAYFCKKHLLIYVYNPTKRQPFCLYLGFMK